MRFIGALLVICLGAAPGWAGLRLAALFTDHMVLQRGMQTPVWGWAAPGASVTVTVGDEIRTATADGAGRWEVRLSARREGGPHTIRVEGDGGTAVIEDVLVGEVWIASGQSNMQWPVSLSANADQEIANANHPGIRLFYVPRKAAETPQSDVDARWTPCNSETVAEFSAVAYFFGRELHAALGVPVGLIHTSYGGTPVELWTSAEKLALLDVFKPTAERLERLHRDFPTLKKRYEDELAAWEKARDRAASGGPDPGARPRAPMDFNHPYRPSSLYNAMVAPLIPYAFQGAIWYQGESNAGRAYQYRELFPAMINDWRRAWGGRKFPFLFVQLANFTERKTDPGESDWAELREAQAMALDLENTGMAVAIDIGDAADIHPKNKQEVGRRLALNALAQTYHRDISHSGPIYKQIVFEGGNIRIRFDHADGGLTAAGDTLNGFAIAGIDKNWVWADAAIEGDSVVVSSPRVAVPVAVRYGWANNPDCNLFNAAGLPASPFRTDDWPGITVDAR